VRFDANTVADKAEKQQASELPKEVEDITDVITLGSLPKDPRYIGLMPYKV
jgi:hypothetical protein